MRIAIFDPSARELREFEAFVKERGGFVELEPVDFSDWSDCPGQQFGRAYAAEVPTLAVKEVKE